MAASPFSLSEIDNNNIFMDIILIFFYVYRNSEYISYVPLLQKSAEDYFLGSNYLSRASMMGFHRIMSEYCGKNLSVFDSDVPAFSMCFQSLTFVTLPFMLLAGTSAYFIGRLQIPDVKIREPNIYKIRKISTAISLLLQSASLLVTFMFQDNTVYAHQMQSYALSSVSLLVHEIFLFRLSKVHFQYKRGPLLVTASWILTFPYFISHMQYVVASALVTSDKFLIIQLVFTSVSCLAQLTYLITMLLPNSNYMAVSLIENEKNEDDEETQSLLAMESHSSSYFDVSSRLQYSLDPQCPADSANMLSRLLFSWVGPLMRKGAKSVLTSEAAVYHLPTDINTSKLEKRFSDCLKRTYVSEIARTRGRSGQNSAFLLKSLHRSFGTIYYVSGLLKLLADSLAFAGPLLLNRLVNFIENSDEPTVHGYYYATGLFLSSLLSSLFSTHFDYQVNKVKLRARSALITAIYSKTLQAEPCELSQYATGEITNFMSTDVDRVINFCPSFHQFWSLPFQVAVTLFLLYQQIGILFLTSVGLAVVMIVFNQYLATKIMKYNAYMMEEKDSRVKLMTEILLGIRVIKFNAWESFLSEKLKKIRQKEIKNLKGIKYFDAGCVYLWATTPILISLLTFSTYSVTGHDLTAAKVFTVIALINMLISPLNAFPWVVNGLMETLVSLRRLNKFLLLKNFDQEKYYEVPESINSDDMDIVIDVQNGTFSWSGENMHTNDNSVPSDDEKDQGLYDISIKIREGQFVGIIGTVGSGKSSLLSAFVAEMRRLNGKIYVDCINDGFALVGQEPWIQHASVRDNILWGKPYNEHLYNAVVEACALVEDLQILPQGDKTEVGENGVTLSGGQKARLALARAVYQDKSLYLLDDPLSAVDQHVASDLHDRCIIGELADKTRILCTHHTKYLRHADFIIVMENGSIKQTGTPEKILKHSSLPIKKQVTKQKTVCSKEQPCETEDDECILNENNDDSLMTEEERAVGTVAFHVYRSYWIAIGSFLASMILLFLFLMQGSKVISDWWLSYWVTNIKNNESSSFYHNVPFSSKINSTFDSQQMKSLCFPQPLVLSATSYTVLLTTDMKSNTTSHDAMWYLMIYGCLAASNSLFTLLRAFLFAYGGISAAKVLHNSMLKTVLKAPISFFDVTPVGRVINRFSSDTYCIDDSLPFILNIFLAQFIGVLGTIVVTVYGLPWFALVLLPLAVFYYYIQYYYRLTSRELKRLSSVSLSPIYAHFTETLAGLSTIRAFRKNEMFRKKNLKLVDQNQRCNFSTLAAQEWFGIRLQMIGVAMVTGVAFVTVFMHSGHKVSPGLAGLALSYALSVTGRLYGVITSFTETEKQMVAVERQAYYINNIPKERETTDDEDLNKNTGPSREVVRFFDVSLQYRKGLPLALNNVSLTIEKGEKIGIVGRTGSGKSSLFMLLFGMIEPCNGSIMINGTNIKRSSLTSLRSALSIIPQDPFLFSGSLRENLLPNSGDVDDEQEALLWSALERCNLHEKVVEMGGLYSTAGERGKRLSVGQRQLLCLARALLTDAKIICLDEATANIDGKSDEILQKVIREQFKDRTVLTIAHRIETVLHCDNVLVMNEGRVAEFGPPGTLLSDTDSMFYKLSRSGGGIIN